MVSFGALPEMRIFDFNEVPDFSLLTDHRAWPEAGVRANHRAGLNLAPSIWVKGEYGRLRQSARYANSSWRRSTPRRRATHPPLSRHSHRAAHRGHTPVDPEYPAATDH